MFLKKHFTLFVCTLLIFLLENNPAMAQNQKIGTLLLDDGTNSSPYNANALVDMQSGKKGLLLPRIALQATNVASPINTTFPDPSMAGITVYNTATAGTVPNNVTPGFYYSDGTQWVRISTNAWLLTGNANTTAGTNFLGTTDDNDLIFKRKNIQAGWLNASSYNTSYGVSSMPITSTGGSNTAIGYSALAVNTTSTNNTAIGYTALGANSTGLGWNTAVGSGALSKNTASSNTAVGGDALNANTSGTNNVAIGVSSLLNATGSNNVAMGCQSLQGATGNNNTALGYSAGSNLTAGNNNIVIGYNQQAASNTSNQLNIGGVIFGTGLTGSASSPAGNIGINQTAPASTLDVNGSMATNIVTVTGNYTLTGADYTVIYTGSAASPTFTLPAANTCKGRQYRLVNASGGTTTITLSQPVYMYSGFAAANTLGQDYSGGGVGLTGQLAHTALIQSDGTNWWLVGL